MLAKQAKDAYSLAKSYTPISLTPFIFKLLERVCACYILETALSKTPFHKRQPAYRAMRSKEFAISQVLNEIEKGMTKSSFTLGTFIDISSAMSKMSKKALHLQCLLTSPLLLTNLIQTKPSQQC